MAIRMKTQRDHYLTEAVIELPSNVGQVDELLRAVKTTGKMTVIYNDGGVIGINVEQKTKISEAKAAELRPLLDIQEKIL